PFAAESLPNRSPTGRSESCTTLCTSAAEITSPPSLPGATTLLSLSIELPRSPRYCRGLSGRNFLRRGPRESRDRGISVQCAVFSAPSPVWVTQPINVCRKNICFLNQLSRTKQSEQSLNFSHGS